VLFDRQLLDDELYTLWGQFEEGVRIFVLSDSCHSGSVAKDFQDSGLFAGETPTNLPRPKALPESVRDLTYKANKELYDTLEVENPLGDQLEIGASVILISGCQDNQVSLDGAKNGLFTQTLLDVWNDGRFKGSIRTFHKHILRRIVFYQSPNLFKTGKPDKTFERQRPFTM
jgi:hypothetical protein